MLEEIKKRLEDVEVEEQALKRIENKVFAHIHKQKPKKNHAKMIGVVVAAVVCVGIVTYQVPSVQAWIKETISYIPGFNEKIQKEGGILYTLDSEQKIGKFTIHKAAYEATIPYFHIEFTYDTGTSVDPSDTQAFETQVRSLVKKLENRQVYVRIGNQSFPLQLEGDGYGTDGLWLGKYKLSESVKQLPPLQDNHLTLQFGEEEIGITLSENKETYTQIQSTTVQQYQLQGMVSQKGKNLQISFVNEREMVPFIFDRYPAWVEDSKGQKHDLVPNENSPLVYYNYQVKNIKQRDVEKIVVPYLEQTLSFTGETLSIPIPKEINEEVILPTYHVKGTNMVLEGAKVRRTSEKEIEILLPQREKQQEDWLLDLDIRDSKRERNISKSDNGGSEKEHRMFTPSSYTIAITASDKDVLNLQVEGASIVRYGPWEMKLQ